MDFICHTGCLVHQGSRRRGAGGFIPRTFAIVGILGRHKLLHIIEHIGSVDDLIAPHPKLVPQSVYTDSPDHSGGGTSNIYCMILERINGLGYWEENGVVL